MWGANPEAVKFLSASLKRGRVLELLALG